MTTRGDTYRFLGDLSDVDWDAFDEILLDHPEWEATSAIYQRVRLISDQPRGVRAEMHFPLRLVIRMEELDRDAGLTAVRKLAGPALNELGWIERDEGHLSDLPEL